VASIQQRVIIADGRITDRVSAEHCGRAAFPRVIVDLFSLCLYPSPVIWSCS